MVGVRRVHTSATNRGPVPTSEPLDEMLDERRAHRCRASAMQATAAQDISDSSQKVLSVAPRSVQSLLASGWINAVTDVISLMSAGGR